MASASRSCRTDVDSQGWKVRDVATKHQFHAEYSLGAVCSCELGEYKSPSTPARNRSFTSAMQFLSRQPPVVGGRGRMATARAGEGMT